MRRFAKLFFLLVTLEGVAFAAAVPKDLMYLGKPIDPLCFYEAQEASLVSLKKCGILSEPDRKIKGANDKLLAKGYVGYDYIWPLDKTREQDANCYSYYQFIGKLKDGYVLYTVNNTGGSGEFDSINYVKRTGDEIKVDTLATGDRCNGGVDRAYKKNNQFFFDVHVTAFDFLTIANDNRHRLNAYDDLDACAACCAGIATYRIKPKGKLNHFEFVSLNLDKKLKEVDTDSKVKYQICFDKLYQLYQKQGKHILNRSELAGFVKMFNEQCVR